MRVSFALGFGGTLHRPRANVVRLPKGEIFNLVRPWPATTSMGWSDIGATREKAPALRVQQRCWRVRFRLRTTAVLRFAGSCGGIGLGSWLGGGMSLVGWGWPLSFGWRARR